MVTFFRSLGSDWQGCVSDQGLWEAECSHSSHQAADRADLSDPGLKSVLHGSLCTSKFLWDAMAILLKLETKGLVFLWRIPVT